MRVLVHTIDLETFSKSMTMYNADKLETQKNIVHTLIYVLVHITGMIVSPDVTQVVRFV